MTLEKNKNGHVVLGGIVSAFSGGYCFKIRCEQCDIQTVKKRIKKFLEENGYYGKGWICEHVKKRLR
jgi:hypothetical protein